MGTVITLAYLVLTILSPADLFPSLNGSRILLWIALAAVAGSVANVLRRGIMLAEASSVLVLGMLGAVCMSRIAQGWFGGAVLALESFLPTAIIFFLVILNFNSVGKLRALAWALFLATLFMVLAGINAFMVGVVPSPYLYATGEFHNQGLRLRGLGFLQDPNDFGQQIVIVLALMPILAKKSQRLLKMALWTAVPVFLYAIYLTQSRGTLLGLGALVIGMGWKRMGKVKAVLVSSFLTVSYLAIGFASDRGVSMTESSSSNRLTYWGDGIQMFLHSPVFGAGYKNFSDVAGGHTAHNSFVLCFSELGLFGYLFWMTLFVLAFKQLNRALSTPDAPGVDPELMRVAGAYRNALSVFLVTGWFLSRTYAISIYLLFGAAQAIFQLRRNNVPSPLFRIKIPKVLAFSGVLQFASVLVIYVMVRIHWFMK